MSTQNKQNGNDKTESIVAKPSMVFYAKDVVTSLAKSFRFPQEFDLVALIDSADLDEIFRILNRYDELSDLNFGERSMSVGDVVVKPNGRAWICAPNGWIPIRFGESVDFSKYRRTKL